jgi:hypothetical protein
MVCAISNRIAVIPRVFEVLRRHSVNAGISACSLVCAYGGKFRLATFENHSLKRKNCLLLKRMQLTCTAWVESLNTRNDGWGKTYVLSKTWVSITARLSFHLSQFVYCFLHSKPKVKALATYNSTESNRSLLSDTHRKPLHVILIFL